MFDYRLLSVEDLSKKWEDFCLNIFYLFNQVSERINDDKYSSDNELDTLETLYDEIHSSIDFEHIEDIVAYIQNEKS